MKTLVQVALVFAALAGTWLKAQSPQVLRLEPRTAKPGQEIVAKGISLDTTRVEDVFLTDHKFDLKVKVLEQKGEEIRFRVPPFAKPGRMQLLLLTAGDSPKLLEQPLYVMIEEGTAEVTQVKDPAKDPTKEKEPEPKEGNKEPVKQ
jgi:hypothetical protein